MSSSDEDYPVLPIAAAHSPCVGCGACCAHFRASFYWAEADDATPGGVPVELTKPFGPFRRMMIGTGGSNPRCVSLVGAIGVNAHCEIYERRSSVCRAFVPSYENGLPNPRCDRARAAHGLQPLTPDSWPHAPKPLAPKPRAA